MSAARSFLARRVIAGVEQWRGLKSNWATQIKDECVYCKERHAVAFSYFLQKCPVTAEFRRQIERLWADVPWDDDLLEGRVSHKVMQKMMDVAAAKEKAPQEARARVRKWERALDELCRKVKGRKSKT